MEVQTREDVSATFRDTRGSICGVLCGFGPKGTNSDTQVTATVPNRGLHVPHHGGKPGWIWDLVRNVRGALLVPSHHHPHHLQVGPRGNDGHDQRHETHRGDGREVQGVAALFTVDSDTQITAIVPAGAITGKITVKTPAGKATSPPRFTVT